MPLCDKCTFICSPKFQIVVIFTKNNFRQLPPALAQPPHRPAASLSNRALPVLRAQQMPLYPNLLELCHRSPARPWRLAWRVAMRRGV